MNENEKKDLHPTQRSQTNFLVHRYGSAKQFLSTWSIENVDKYTADVRRCIMGNAPTFVAIKAAYGHEVSETWLCIAWTEINEYAGNSGKLTEHQLRRLARRTMSGYGYLNIAEYMLFVRWMEEGRYDHIFGKNVDPLQLMTALGEFVGQRNELIGRYEQKEREERERLERETNPVMTYEEWCAKHGRKPNERILKLTTT